MQLVNTCIRFTANNIFIIIIKPTTNEIIRVQTLGKLGFQNRQKQLFETFNLLLTDTLNYLFSRNLYINKMFLNQLDQSKIKLIKSQFSNINISEISFVQIINHNGCRRKKLMRRRNRGLKLGKFKL